MATTLADAAAEKVLNGLHKFAGIRRPDLLNFARPALGLWRLSGETDPLTLRATLICRLTDVLRALGDERLERVGRVAYNLERDLEFCQPLLRNRFRALDEREYLGQRTAQRLFTGAIQPKVVRDMRAPILPIPAATLAAELRRERDFTRTPGADIHLVEHRTEAEIRMRQAIRGIYRPPLDDCIDYLVGSEVLTPQGEQSGLVVIKTATEGYWVCAFTDPDLLAAFVSAAGMTATDNGRRIRGAELIQEILGLPSATGLLLDPPADGSDDISSTLPLPPDRVREIALRL